MVGSIVIGASSRNRKIRFFGFPFEPSPAEPKINRKQESKQTTLVGRIPRILKIDEGSVLVWDAPFPLSETPESCPQNPSYGPETFYFKLETLV